MASIGTLIVQMAVDTARFQGDLGRAANIAESRMRNIRDTATKAFAAITVAATAAGAALTAAVKSAINRADDMRDLAQGAGVSVEAMSRLAYAAKQSGTEVEVVAKALAKLAKGGASDPLKSLEELADRFAALPDGAEKTALAIEVLGERLGPQLVALLNLGKVGLREVGEEADRLRITIGTDAAAAADEFNDRMAMLRGTIDGLGNSLAAKLLPIMNDVADRFADAATSAESLDRASRQLATAFKILATAGLVLYRTFDLVGTALGSRAAAAVAIASGEFSRAAEIIRLAQEDEVRSQATANDLLKAIWADRAEAAEQTATRIARSQVQAVSRGNDPVVNRARTIYDPKADANAQAEAKAAAEKAFREQLRRAAEQQDALAREYARVYEEGAAAMQSLETPTERILRNFEEQKAALEALAQTYPSFADQAQEAIERLAVITDDQLEDLKRMPTEVEEVSNQMTVFAEEAGRNMQSAFANFLFDPFKQGLDGMLASFLDTIRRMVAELIAQQALASFFGMLAGATTGGVSSFFTSLAGKRAEGGPVTAGSAYLVGERGPELFTPRTSGTIIPNNAMGGSVAVHYSIDARGADAERIMAILPGMLRQTEQRTIAAVLHMQRQGRFA